MALSLPYALLIFIFSTPSFLYAQQFETGFASYLKFTAGIVAAYSVHELGHAAGGWATGTNLKWKAGTYNQPLGYEERSDNDREGLTISSAGLVFQLLSSEVILNYDKIDKKRSYTHGFMVWNIINPLIYSLDYWVIRRTNRDFDGSYQGDLQGVEYYSDKKTADVFAAAISVAALWHGYRYYTHPDHAIKQSERKHSMILIPDRPDRIKLAYRYRF